MLRHRRAVLRRRFWHPFTGLVWVVGLTAIVAVAGLRYDGATTALALAGCLGLTAGFATSGST